MLVLLTPHAHTHTYTHANKYNMYDKYNIYYTYIYTHILCVHIVHTHYDAQHAREISIGIIIMYTSIVEQTYYLPTRICTHRAHTLPMPCCLYAYTYIERMFYVVCFAEQEHTYLYAYMYATHVHIPIRITYTIIEHMCYTCLHAYMLIHTHLYAYTPTRIVHMY